MVTHGQYAEALREAAELAAEHPDDPHYARLHQLTSVGFLMEAGRRATLDDRDTEALEYFERALQIDPESVHAQAWGQKTRHKLGDIWYARARQLHADDDLLGALEAYETALEYDPTLNFARENAGRVVLQLNYREGLSEGYYNDGVRALNDYRLHEAKSRFAYVGKYREADDKSKRRVREVDRQLSIERAIIAFGHEQTGLYTAARNEFKWALILDPENADAQEGLARNEIEAEASRLLHEGEMMVLRGEWERGKAMLEEGKRLTIEQHEAFDEALAKIDDARLKAMYERGLAYEHDFRYREAIEVYAQVLESRAYYEDTRPRKETLEEYVQRAGELYSQAAAAESEAARLRLLRQIEVIWPEYEDVGEQIEALEQGGDERGE